MPIRIPDTEAIARIASERTDDGCLVCAIVGRRAGAVHVVHEDESIVVLLPRYVARWGHVMIAPRAHATSVAGLSLETWQRMSAAAHRSVAVVERLHAPLRVYVASTGARASGLVHTADHVHLHVVPVYEPDDRPRDVLTWKHGVLVGEPGEWHDLLERTRVAWEQRGPA